MITFDKKSTLQQSFIIWTEKYVRGSRSVYRPTFRTDEAGVHFGVFLVSSSELDTHELTNISRLVDFYGSRE